MQGVGGDLAAAQGSGLQAAAAGAQRPRAAGARQLGDGSGVFVGAEAGRREGGTWAETPSPPSPPSSPPSVKA